MKLRQWQKLGHHVIFLIGDFTAMIGDPTGKYSSRKVLSHEQTLENAKNYKEQASKILSFEGENPAELLYNGEWLGKMSAIEFLQIARNITISQLVERDMYQERLKKGQDIQASETIYPIMQAYDSVHMGVDLEIGGTDQMFNMLMGRKLMRNMNEKEKFVMTLTLIEDAEGKKIGKTEGNAIALTDAPNDLFGKIMSFPDEVLSKCFEALTEVPMEEVKEIENKIKAGENPMIFKKKLAFELTKMLNDQKAAEEAQENFEKTVQSGETPTDIPTIALKEKKQLLDVLVEAHLAASKSEARRLVEQGAVEVDGKKVAENIELFPTDGTIIKAGKRKYIKLTVN
jgi:tyrosyl-tRNA synthetase